MSDLVRVAISVHADAVEQVLARLFELAPGGIEQVDRDDVVELAVYVAAEEAAAVSAVFPDAVAVPVAAGWQDAWRGFHRPVVVGGLWIGPPWLDPPEGVPAVVVDPGRAFGTGAHPTTRLCVELLARVERRGSLLDVGCGSGVLAVAGARLGFAPVLALDDDPVAVEVTRATAVANGVEVHACVADGLRDPLPRADVAVANVLLEPVEQILARLDSRIAITSGYLVGERPSHEGWRHVETLDLDGWAADLFARPS